MAERGTNPTSIHEDAGDLDPLMKFSKLDVQSLRYLFFFLFWLHPQRMEVPGPGIESEP